jgi:hypothetical protein
MNFIELVESETEKLDSNGIREEAIAKFPDMEYKGIHEGKVIMANDLYVTVFESEEVHQKHSVALLIEQEDTELLYYIPESVLLFAGIGILTFVGGAVAGAAFDRKMAKLVQKVRMKFSDLFGFRARKFNKMLGNIQDLVQDMTKYERPSDMEDAQYDKVLADFASRYDRAANDLDMFLKKENNQAFVGAMDKEDLTTLKEIYDTASETIQSREVEQVMQTQAKRLSMTMSRRKVR